MSCQHVLSLLSAYIDREVQSSDSEMIREHLDQCAACTRELDLLRRTSAMLGTVSEVEPPVFLLEQIEAATVKRPTFTARLRAAFEPVWRSPQYVRWSAAGVVAAGALVAILVFQPGMQRMAQGPAGVPGSPSKGTVAVRPAPGGSPQELASRPIPEVPSITVTERPRRGTNLHRRSVPRHAVTTAKAPAPAKIAPPTPAAEAALPAESPGALVDAAPADQLLLAAEPSEPSDAALDAKRKSAPSELAVAEGPASLAARLAQDTDALADLRAKLAARNKQRKYDTHLERIEGGKYSVQLASIRF